jgi:hypothetical protein
MFPSERARYEKELDPLQETSEWAAGRELKLEDAVSLAKQYLD